MKTFLIEAKYVRAQYSSFRKKDRRELLLIPTLMGWIRFHEQWKKWSKMYEERD